MLMTWLNSLAPGRCSYMFKNAFLIITCVSVTITHRCHINIGSDNSLMPSGHKPSAEPKLSSNGNISVLLALWAGNYRSPVNSLHKGRWHGALVFPLICTGTNTWANNWDAGDLKRHRDHYHSTLMWRISTKQKGGIWSHWGNRN